MGESNSTEKENKYRPIIINTSNLGWNKTQTIIILILLLVILLMRQCGGSKNTKPVEPKVVTKIETVWDTLEIEKEVYVPKWRTKVVTKYDTTFIEVETKIDTLNILKDYYSKYVYVDTLSLDSIGYITVVDTITENKILRRSLDRKIQIPTKIVNNTVYINEREFYAGMGARTNGSNITWMGLEGVYRAKTGNTYLIGVGTDNENKISVGGSVHWRIGGN